MPQTFKIDFQAGSVRNLSAELRRAAQDAHALAAALNRVMGATGGGGAPAARGGAAGGTPGLVRASSGLPAGPFQRFQQAQASFSRALQVGTAAQVQDAALYLNRAQTAVTRAQRQLSGNNNLNRLSRLVSSTRVGIGANGVSVMPLIGQLAAAAGPEVAIIIGVVLAAVELVSLQLKMFGAAVQHAAEILGAFGVAQAATGATGGQIAAAASLGISPAQFTAMSAGFQGATSQGGLAGVARIMLGGGVGMPRPFSGDEGANLAATLKNLEKMFDRETAAGTGHGGPFGSRSLARMLGLPEGILNTFDVSASVKAARGQNTAVSGALATPDFITKANSLTESFRLISSAWDNVIVAFGRAAFEPITNGLLAIADALNKLAVWMAAHPQMVASMGVMLEQGLRLIAGIITALPKMWDVFIGIFNSMAGVFGLPQIKPIDFKPLIDPLTGIEKNTSVLPGIFGAGTFGGGPRAAGGIPSGVTGRMLDAAIAGNALRLGAFSV